MRRATRGTVSKTPLGKSGVFKIIVNREKRIDKGQGAMLLTAYSRR